MKIAKVVIKDKEYYTALSTRVMFHIQERTERTIDEELKYISQTMDIKEIFWLLNELLVAGDVYATKEHMEHNAPPCFDDLIDLIGVDDYETMFAGITETISNGEKADLDAKIKNAKAL